MTGPSLRTNGDPRPWSWFTATDCGPRLHTAVLIKLIISETPQNEVFLLLK
jgi:hypothetical protein